MDWDTLIIHDGIERLAESSLHFTAPALHLGSNRNLDLNTSLNIDNDLLDNLGRSVETR